MDILNKVSMKVCSLASITVRNILNLIENCHNKFYQVLNTLNCIPSQYTSKIASFEQQLKTYSPIALIVFGLFLIFLFYFLQKCYEFLKKIINFFVNIKQNIALLYCKLPGPKTKLAEVIKAN